MHPVGAGLPHCYCDDCFTAALLLYGCALDAVTDRSEAERPGKSVTPFARDESAERRGEPGGGRSEIDRTRAQRK